MTIFVPKITPRVAYTLEFVFAEILQLPFSISQDKEIFNSSEDTVKWSYGEEIAGYPFLPAIELLFENTISPQKTTKIQHEYIEPIFKTGEGLGFDIFASIFYHISRYEEYLPSVVDTHGRYAAYQSILSEYKQLDKAVVNRYVQWIRAWLVKNFPHLTIKKPSSSILFSIDVDHPFYTKDVRLDRKIWRGIKDLADGLQKDRFDTYDFILDNLGALPSIFFFLCPKSPSAMDNYNSRESEAFVSLIRHIKQKSKIGIHPSYYAVEKGLLTEETHWLSQVHERPIKSSRYHYLKNSVERSYSVLVEAGIQHDFSMAYGNISGFRSGTSLPFYYFDLKKNQKTNVLIYTPCIMDSTYEYGLQENFEDQFKKLFQEIKEYGGVFLPIFHNDILSKEEWKTQFITSINLVKDYV